LQTGKLIEEANKRAIAKQLLSTFGLLEAEGIHSLSSKPHTKKQAYATGDSFLGFEEDQFTETGLLKGPESFE
jgi:hypothetical protein